MSLYYSIFCHLSPHSKTQLNFDRFICSVCSTDYSIRLTIIWVRCGLFHCLYLQLIFVFFISFSVLVMFEYCGVLLQWYTWLQQYGEQKIKYSIAFQLVNTKLDTKWKPKILISINNELFCWLAGWLSGFGEFQWPFMNIPPFFNIIINIYAAAYNFSTVLNQHIFRGKIILMCKSILKNL